MNKIEIVKTEVVARNNASMTIIEVRSMTSDRTYRVDVSTGRCSCPAWKFQKGHGKACKHMIALGVPNMRAPAPMAAPKAVAGYAEAL